MTFTVLKTNKQILEARKILKLNKISFTSNKIIEKLRNRKLLPGVNVGHDLKSWDVLSTINFIKVNYSKESRILDMGAYGSEVLPILHKLNYKHLHGIDLNSELTKMPYRKSIIYTVGDYYELNNYKNTYDVITSISAIEHGFNDEKILNAISNLLNNGGTFVCTFDYWGEKINTNNIKMFNLDWIIFSQEEIQKFIVKASKYNLIPFGDINFSYVDKAIKWADREYTFGYLVLKKIS